MINLKLFILLYAQIGYLYTCPFCLSMPKNEERPFFIDEKDEHINNFDQLLSVLPTTESND